MTIDDPTSQHGPHHADARELFEHIDRAAGAFTPERLEDKLQQLMAGGDALPTLADGLLGSVDPADLERMAQGTLAVECAAEAARAQLAILERKLKVAQTRLDAAEARAMYAEERAVQAAERADASEATVDAYVDVALERGGEITDQAHATARKTIADAEARAERIIADAHQAARIAAAEQIRPAWSNHEPLSPRRLLPTVDGQHRLAVTDLVVVRHGRIFRHFLADFDEGRSCISPSDFLTAEELLTAVADPSRLRCFLPSELLGIAGPAAPDNRYEQLELFTPGEVSGSAFDVVPRPVREAFVPAEPDPEVQRAVRLYAGLVAARLVVARDVQQVGFGAMLAAALLRSRGVDLGGGTSDPGLFEEDTLKVTTCAGLAAERFFETAACEPRTVVVWDALSSHVIEAEPTAQTDDSHSQAAGELGQALTALD